MFTKVASSVVTGGWQGDDAEYNFNILTPTVSASAASGGKVLVVGNINVDQYIGTEGRPENFNPSLLNLDNNPQGVTMKDGVVSLNVNLTASDKVFIGTLKYNHSPIGQLYVSPSITGN